MTPARLMPSLVSSLMSSRRSMSACEYMRVLPLVRWGVTRPFCSYARKGLRVHACQFAQPR